MEPGSGEGARAESKVQREPPGQAALENNTVAKVQTARKVNYSSWLQASPFLDEQEGKS